MFVASVGGLQYEMMDPCCAFYAFWLESQACSSSLRHCSLELGGKSALVLFADWLATAASPDEREDRLRQAIDWIMIGMVQFIIVITRFSQS
jgi:hypothetical protein